MKIFLEPKGWPVKIEKAPRGLVMRVRKGRIDLFLKVDSIDNTNLAIYNSSGDLTTVTGNVTPVIIRKEEK